MTRTFVHDISIVTHAGIEVSYKPVSNYVLHLIRTLEGG